MTINLPNVFDKNCRFRTLEIAFQSIKIPKCINFSITGKKFLLFTNFAGNKRFLNHAVITRNDDKLCFPVVQILSLALLLNLSCYDSIHGSKYILLFHYVLAKTFR